MLRRLILVSLLTVSSVAFAAEQQNAAHNLAQKFAGAPDGATEGKPAPSAKLPAKLAKAPEPEKKAVVAAEQAAPQRPSLDYEMDMLRRARAERAEQQKSNAPLTNVPAATAAAPTSTGKIVVTPPAAPVATVPAPSKTAATTSTPAVAAPVTPPAPSAPAMGTGSAPAAYPAATPPTPAAAPAKVVEAAPKPVTPPPAVQAKADAPVADPKTAAPSAVAAPVAAQLPAAQASVLLAIETGGASSKSGNAQDFDPIICLADACFVSNGLSNDAVKLSKADALKLKSTKDASQDACKGKVGCVFRNVSITSGAQIRVVDLGSPSTDAARTYDAQLDKSCASTDSALACENPIATPDFRIWIVPEATAKSAGTQAIEDAVADSLPHRDIARDTDK